MERVVLELIVLEGKDKLLAEIAQGARVCGATLPSGLKVPTTEGKKWVIRGNFIICVSIEYKPDHCSENV